MLSELQTHLTVFLHMAGYACCPAHTVMRHILSTTQTCMAASKWVTTRSEVVRNHVQVVVQRMKSGCKVWEKENKKVREA